MEVITMLKFWKSNNNSKVAAGTTSSDGETFASSTISDHLSDYSDDDDFFELELDSKHSLSSPYSKTTTTSLKKSFNLEDDERENEVKLKSKPQSPISILRAAASPKLQVFMFGRFNKKSKHSDEVCDSDTVSSPKRSNSSLFTVKFRIEDGSIVPKLTRNGSNNSSSVSSSPKIEKHSSDNFNESSKRFSKDSIQKYINRIKPKSTKNSTNNLEKFIASPTRPSTTSSRFKVKSNKQLGKCKSSSAVIGVNHQSPTNLATRNECPQDGIEGAILHCKRSFSSSIGHSSLSRCSSDPSHEKSIQVSEVI